MQLPTLDKLPKNPTPSQIKYIIKYAILGKSFIDKQGNNLVYDILDYEIEGNKLTGTFSALDKRQYDFTYNLSSNELGYSLQAESKPVELSQQLSVQLQLAKGEGYPCKNGWCNKDLICSSTPDQVTSSYLNLLFGDTVFNRDSVLKSIILLLNPSLSDITIASTIWGKDSVKGIFSNDLANAHNYYAFEASASKVSYQPVNTSGTKLALAAPEPKPSSDPISAMADRLRDESRPQLEKWVELANGYVDEMASKGKSLTQIRDGLTVLFKEMDGDKLASQMALAMRASKYAGVYSAQEEGGTVPKEFAAGEPVRDENGRFASTGGAIASGKGSTLSKIGKLNEHFDDREQQLSEQHADEIKARLGKSLETGENQPQIKPFADLEAEKNTHIGTILEKHIEDIKGKEFKNPEDILKESKKLEMIDQEGASLHPKTFEHAYGVLADKMSSHIDTVTSAPRMPDSVKSAQKLKEKIDAQTLSFNGEDGVHDVAPIHGKDSDKLNSYIEGTTRTVIKGLDRTERDKAEKVTRQLDRRSQGRAFAAHDDSIEADLTDIISQTSYLDGVTLTGYELDGENIAVTFEAEGRSFRGVLGGAENSFAIVDEDGGVTELAKGDGQPCGRGWIHADKVCRIGVHADLQGKTEATKKKIADHHARVKAEEDAKKPEPKPKAKVEIKQEEKPKQEEKVKSEGEKENQPIENEKEKRAKELIDKFGTIHMTEAERFEETREVAGYPVEVNNFPSLVPGIDRKIPVSNINLLTKGGYSKAATKRLDDKTKLKMALTGRSIFLEKLKGMPDGTLLTNTPFNNDGNGHDRARLYEKAGFSLPENINEVKKGSKKDLGKMFGIVKNGKLIPITKQEIIELHAASK